jgi:hypothetical protein
LLSQKVPPAQTRFLRESGKLVGTATRIDYQSEPVYFDNQASQGTAAKLALCITGDAR